MLLRPVKSQDNGLCIHEWIFATMRIPEHKILMIQIDGIKRQVYIKLTDNDCALARLRETGGQAEYKYPTGELFIVNITMAGYGHKTRSCSRLTAGGNKRNARRIFGPVRQNSRYPSRNMD
jgi:hypothetical protein